MIGFEPMISRLSAVCIKPLCYIPKVGTPGIEPRPHVLQTYVPTNLHHVPESGWQDLNLRPELSKSPALTKLRYTQLVFLKGFEPSFPP